MSSACACIGCHLPCCSGCPTGGLIGAAGTARSSQGHLVSSNWSVWADQPTVHHSLWEDHFNSYHTPQHTFLLTIGHHRPKSGQEYYIRVAVRGNGTFSSWEPVTLQRCETTTPACVTVLQWYWIDRINMHNLTFMSSACASSRPPLHLLQWVPQSWSHWCQCSPEE